MAKLEKHPSREEFEKLVADKDAVIQRLQNLAADAEKLRSQPTSARRVGYETNISAAVVRLQRRLTALKMKMAALKAKMTKDVFNEADVVRP